MEFRLGRTSAGAARKPRELFAHEVLATFFGHSLDALALDALEHIRRVATLERLDLSIVHFPHTRAHLVEEPAVVRDAQKRTGIALPAAVEMPREPCNSANVQVVGGLVHHNDVVVANEQARKVDPSALSAGKRSDLRVPIDVGDELRDNLANAGVARPFVFRRVAHHRIAHGGLVRKRVGLAEHADGEPARATHEPVLELDLPSEHAKQRRFSVAVFADDANAVALVHAERHVVKHELCGKFEMGAFAPHKKRHRWVLSFRVTRR